MNRKYELLIFDWDGTLMDSEAKIVRCFHAAANDAEVEYPGDNAVRAVIGLGLTEAIDELFPENTNEARTIVCERYRQHFLYLDDTKTNLFPGVVDGLTKLARRGFRLAVATGKARRGLDRVLEDSPVRDLFHSTRCSDETRSKPHPLMLEEILEETGIDRTQALMIGDTVFDLEMANNAGTDALAVNYGVHDADRLKACRPLACMDSFDDVYDWINTGGASYYS